MEGFTKRTQLLQRSINPFDRQSIRHRHQEIDDDGPSALTFAAPAFRCAVCTRHGLIIYVAVQPLNDKVLWIGPDCHPLVRVRKQALPRSADRRHDQEAPDRDHGGGEGRRRDLALAKVA